MKRILIVVFVFFSLFSKAQFGIGPKVGVAFSSDLVLFPAYFDFNESRQSFVGANYSLSMMLGKGSVFHFQPEIFYSQIGSRYYAKDDDITFTQKRNYGGLNILFDVGFTKDKIRFYGQSGIYLALLTSGLLEIEESGQTTYNSLHTANSIYGDSGLPIDFGFAFGFGLEYKLANGWLGLNPRFKVGLLPHSTDSVYDTQLFNKSLTVNLSYIFILGRKA